MCSASVEQGANNVSRPADRTKSRFPSYGDDPKVLADIYQEDVNIAIWHRHIGEHLENAVNEFLAASPRFVSGGDDDDRDLTSFDGA